MRVTFGHNEGSPKVFCRRLQAMTLRLDAEDIYGTNLEIDNVMTDLRVVLDENNTRQR